MNSVFIGLGLLLLQSQLANVSGIVSRPGGNEPLAGAMVSLNPVFPADSARIRTTTSAEDGRFSLPDIEPGDYRLQAQSQFYGFATYGERKPNGPGAILTIGSGQRLSDLKVTMTPTGAIAGRITGRNGEPLAYANVQALKYLYQDGRRILSVVQTATTDDRGDYRLFWLTSGKYVVVAGPRSSPITTEPIRPLRPGESLRTGGPLIAALMLALGPSADALLEGTSLVKRILEDGSVQEESWMPTYYPTTIDRNRATPIDIAAGSNVTGIDITLGPSPVQKISGRVTGGTPASQVMVSLASGSPGMIGRAVTKAISSVDASFEFSGVVPGVYFLSAQDRAGLVAMPMAVSVADRDVEGLSMALSTGVTLSVRITAEGLTQGPSDPLTGLVGTLAAVDAPPGSSPGNIRATNAPIAPGNQFTFVNLAPGDYQFSINQAVIRDNIKRLFIKSMRFGREDALGTVHVSSDRDILEVVLTTQTGSVEGIAVDRAGDPAPNATVVLVPVTARRRASLYKTLITGKDGKYRFQEIPPGDYKLFAWDDIETGAWENAEFMQSYESRGRSVRVAESAREEAELSVIYNP